MKPKVSDQDIGLPDADEFHLAMTSSVRQQIVSWLHGEEAANAFERGVMCVLTRSPGRRRLTYLIHEVISPEPGDVELTGGVEFSAGYRRRVKRCADEVGGGVLYLHTHPGGEGRPSRQDVEGGRRLLHNDAQHLKHSNPPLAIGILTPENKWMILGCEYPKGTNLSEGNPRYATAIRVVGKKFEKLKTYSGSKNTSGAAGAAGALDPETQDRQIRLWTDAAQEAYAALRVGIVGLGGGGSILAEHLARAGIDGLVLVDYDVVKNENLNRQQGATAVDASVWQPKVDVAARVARQAATNPTFDVEKLPRSVVEDDPDLSGYRELLDCDVILHAADGHWTTQVLDQIAYAHLIPVISGGTRPDITEAGTLKKTTKSPITVSSPGHSCFSCTRQFNVQKAEKVRHGGESPGPDYNLGGEDQVEAETEDGNDQPAPSVISLNAIVAGLMHLRLQDLTLGVTGHVLGERRFLPAAWDIVSGREACRADCDREELTAAGQTHIFPLSTDHKFKEIRAEVQARFTPYW
jgi:hypothetical protein